MSNVLTYTATEALRSARFQLFNNVKIITTALIFRCVMHKSLRFVQWRLCIVFLMIAMVVASGCGNGLTVAEGGPSFLPATLVVTPIAIISSSAAGVYNERVLKGQPQHPMLQNSVLYTWVMPFCPVHYAFTPLGGAAGAEECRVGSSWLCPVVLLNLHGGIARPGLEPDVFVL